MESDFAIAEREHEEKREREEKGSQHRISLSQWYGQWLVHFPSTSNKLSLNSRNRYNFYGQLCT